MVDEAAITDGGPVLRRKVRRPPRDDARASPQRLLLRAALRAISSSAGLSAGAEENPPVDLGLEELVEHVPDGGYVALLTAAEGEGGGLVALDDGLFASLIEGMTLGRLSQRPPPPRRPTATDGALIAVVIERFLADIGTTAAPSPAGAPPDAAPASPDDPVSGAALPPGGWRLGRPLGDLRLIGALLDEGRYRLFRLAVTFEAEGAGRGGDLLLMLPAARLSVPGRDGAACSDPAAAPDPFHTDFEAAVMAAPAEFDAVLGRLRMSLAQVMALEAGCRIELPVARLEEVQLTGIDGCQHALARLGQSRGMRALRVISLSGAGERGLSVTSSPVPEQSQGFAAAAHGRAGTE